MPYKETAATARANSLTKVWDTQYYPPSKAFSVFREGICSTFMPWSPELKSGLAFEARIESLSCETGSMARVSMTPLIAVRTKANLAASKIDGIYANFILSGELNVEQGGVSVLAKQGDLVVYDSELPVTHTGGGRHYEDLSFLIPKSSFASVPRLQDSFRNILLSRGKMISPLASCLSFLAGNMSTETDEELTAIFDAFVLLLPVAGCFHAEKKEASPLASASHMLSEILEFVDRSLADVDLSPSRAAEHFGITARYVHKVFAASSTTFSSYVLAKRLEHIRGDLLSPSCRNQPISILAYRWGFNDLSSFNRAFKNRFRCSPSEFRARFAR
jgi:AraC-like DNA-binding protein